MLKLHIYGTLISRKTKDDTNNTVDDNYDDGVDDYVVLLVMIMMAMIALVKMTMRKDTTRQNCNFSIYFRNKLPSFVPI